MVTEPADLARRGPVPVKAHPLVTVVPGSLLMGTILIVAVDAH